MKKVGTVLTIICVTVIAVFAALVYWAVKEEEAAKNIAMYHGHGTEEQ